MSVCALIARPLTAALAVLAFTAAVAPAQEWADAPAITTQDIHFMENGIAVGNAGFYASLSTDGTTWTSYNPGTTADLHGFVGSGNNFWVSGSGGTLMVNTSGNLSNRSIPDGGHAYAVYSKTTGWAAAVGDGGSIYFTADFGQHWTLTASGYPAFRRHIQVSSGVIAVGDQGTILRSTDYGQHWTQVASGTTANLWGVVGGTSGTYVAVGDNGTILRSEDSGVTWTQIPSGTTAGLRGVSASKANGLWMLAVGRGGATLKSTDGGKTWCALNSGTTADLSTADMQSNSRYVVAGAGGVVRRTETGGGACQTTGIHEGVRDAADEARLLTVRVDGGRVALTASVEATEAFDVAVFDAAGRPLSALALARLAPGTARLLDLRAAGAATGVYFVRIANSRVDAVRRVLVVR